MAGAMVAGAVMLGGATACAQTSPSACRVATFEPPARINASSLRSLSWAPFRRDEIGWETYAPLIQRELGTLCAPDTSRFSQLLAGFQKRFRLKGTGEMDAATFNVFKGVWQERRPFVMVNVDGYCPPPPMSLVVAAPAESYGGKTIPLRPGTLDAYRRMVAAAKRVPAIAKDSRNLTIFSGFRDPDADAARCVTEGNCDGVVRATCSPHRTGLALDLYVGQAPDYGPDSSADPNRLHMSNTPTYRWLLANAHRFGFVNYPFEPWHWEWIGQAP
ncbi:D-alanyl-D-alanine carboxypeptidase family protein [Phenylobacterium sp.]|uniref:M15 family metallopeptidase n=1 Tax=Phenylobacterium sp. TaxID=1871053 RepID=UPI00286E9DCF|nr:D-alanyl-D-alanine carboxypeptidase family protein [Phenylobacterium sp.]